MTMYNCYTYALGLADKKRNPGYFTGDEYDGSASIEAMVALVVADIKSGHSELGTTYHCVKTQTTRPTSTSGWYNVIAARKDTQNGADNDFHFAKLTADGWLHKPGELAVLKFNNPPSNDVVWNNEGLYDSIYVEPNAYYNSDIIYILYREAHNVQSTCIFDRHVGTQHTYKYRDICLDCGHVSTRTVTRACSGPPCNMTQSIPEDEPVTE